MKRSVFVAVVMQRSCRVRPQNEREKSNPEDGAPLLVYISWGSIDLVSASTGEISKQYDFIYVDKEDQGAGTLTRQKNESFDWYKKVIASHEADLE